MLEPSLWLCLFFLTPQAAFADASTYCLYDLLVQSHAAISHCGDSLDPKSERRYQQLISEIRTNIIHNAHKPNKKGGSIVESINQYDRTVQMRTQNAGDAVCKSRNYPDSRDMLKRFTAEPNFSKLLASIRHSTKDPFTGECI